MRILFLAPYPHAAAPSQRFRYEQYLDILKKNGHEYRVSEFLDSKAWSILYLKGHVLKKAFAILRGFFRRILDVFSLSNYDFVFVHREASPFGPPIFEWLIARVFRKQIIYDFDDAIWLYNSSESNSKLTGRLKNFSKVRKICSWATKISVGNQFLKDFAIQYNKHVTINPTTIDTDLHHNLTAKHNNNNFVFGWTGSHSTVQYLDIIWPVLLELERTEKFEFHVICDVEPKIKLKSMKFISWRKETEIEDLLNFNIGLMPLPDDLWSKGKCGFKALQYMALGIPAVVSDVGVNSHIVDHDVNGIVCKSIEDWNLYLRRLMKDLNYRNQLSLNTRKKIIDKYSVQSNKANFLSLFDNK